VLDESVVARAVGDRESGGLFEVETVGNRHCKVLGDRATFRERAGRRSDDDLVADLEATGAFADCGNDARSLVSRDERRWHLYLVLPANHEHVREVQTGGHDVDHNFAGAGDRVVNVFNRKVIRGPVGLADECPHQATSNSDAAPCPPPMHIVQTTYFAPRRLPSINVPDHAGTGHAVGMADRYRAAIDVENLVRDTEFVAAIDDLHRKCLEEFRHGKDRADAHLVGLAACDGSAAIEAERLESALLGHAGLHHDRSRRTVRKLARVAGRNEAVFADRGQSLQSLERGRGSVAFVLLQHDVLESDLAGLLVHDPLVGRQRHDLVIEAPGFLCGGRALLALQRVLVLGLAADAVTTRHDFGGVDHRHVDVFVHLEETRVFGAEQVHVFVLNQADRFQSATDHDVDVIDHDGFRSHGDGHHAGGTLAVDGHARCRDGQAAGERRLPRNVMPLGPLRQGTAHHHVFDFRGLQAGTLHGMTHHVTAERCCFCIVERATVGLADRCACGGDDYGFAHVGVPLLQVQNMYIASISAMSAGLSSFSMSIVISVFMSQCPGFFSATSMIVCRARMRFPTRTGVRNRTLSEP
jgi:hypothetical protein